MGRAADWGERGRSRIFDTEHRARIRLEQPTPPTVLKHNPWRHKGAKLQFFSRFTRIDGLPEAWVGGQVCDREQLLRRERCATRRIF